ncbi:hypothetical protein GCHA_4101 [Paraglaciecola chathamensis S18K6]|uniref:Uncharacterized protein n=1 Tax=Paraglaciecola chathamensis S18K6 TaxID=1127672 RepID=A0AAV3V5U9_9ALTE|nr:hypothetical protein GCHA_4101 [Paraglaciecola chathamensis S18K6]
MYLGEFFLSIHVLSIYFFDFQSSHSNIMLKRLSQYVINKLNASIGTLYPIRCALVFFFRDGFFFVECFVYVFLSI